MRIDTDQARYANGCAGFLELHDLFLHRAIGHGHAAAQALVFGPGRDDVALDEAIMLGDIAKHAPVACAIAPPCRLDRVNCAHESRLTVWRNAVFDLDQYR